MPSAPESALVHAPLSARPSPLPRRAFRDAAAASTHFNSLAAAVSLDEPWLEATLAAAAQADDFTARLLEVLRKTREYRGSGSEVVLLLSRSDYLLDKPSSKLLQVELNTVASSFGCLGDAASGMHLALAAKREWAVAGENERGEEQRFSLPENGARAALASGLAAAFAEVVGNSPCSSSSSSSSSSSAAAADSVCLFVVQPGEKNAYDQALLAEALFVNHGVPSVRVTLREIAERVTFLDGGNDGGGGKTRRPLFLDGKRVAVAYLRSGYGPSDYPSELEWRAREILEKADAALCPSVALQLAGAKKVQQALAAPGVTEKFLEATPSELVRAHFAGLWGLDGAVPEEAAAASEALKDALARPEDFVLKPQREGGGNNLYGEQLRAEIVRGGSEAGPALAGYILMQRILPATHRALLVRNGTAKSVDAVSELGIFGAHLRRGSKTLLNERAGHLLRTKPSDADEGGVASGYAVLDSPMLVDYGE